jgi:hypothetical protein
VCYPRNKTVRVHHPAAPVEILHANVMLTAEDVLPGFAVRVGDLCPE